MTQPQGAPEPPDPRPTSRRQLRALAGGRPAGPAGGIAQAGQAQFSLAAPVGGVRGVVEALAPGVLFIVAFTVMHDLRDALVVAVGAAVLLFAARLVTRSSPVQAVSGLVGVVICAVVAYRTGEARDFYLTGFLTNIGYGGVYLLSTIPFPRFRIPGTTRHVGPGPYPLLGVVLGFLLGEGMRWRQDPARLRAYQRVTLLWVAMFALRLVVQVPLYLADAVGALGVARLAMGVPLFAATAWLSWMVLRTVPPAVPEDDVPDDVPDDEQGVSRG